jgi:chromosome partitioning protein
VEPGLGWPGAAAAAEMPAWTDLPTEPGLGWPRYPQDPQVDPQDDPGGTPDSDVPDPAVSRETIQPADVSRGTSSEEAAVTTTSTDRSRFGPTPAPGSPVRTAADVAAQPEPVLDESTPLARSVAQELRLLQGTKLDAPLPRPARTRVMVVANQKGGVGKTTTTVNIAASLAQHGLRVLVVDLDPQGNASTALGVDHQRGTPSTYDAIVDGAALADLVQPSPEVPGLAVLPATIDLAGAEIELVSLVARESRLRRAIHGYAPVFGSGADRFDYVLIDCPPSLGLLTLNALVAGDEMLIPIQAEYYALEGLGQLLETVDMVRAHLNPDLAVSTILLTMYDARTRLSAGVADEVRSHFGDQVLRTAIPRSVRISEAPSYGQTVMTYDPGSPGALSYLEAAREMALRAVTEADASAPPATTEALSAEPNVADQTRETR